MAPELANSYQVVAMDVRGHGASIDGPWSWRAAVDDVDAVAEHFQMIAPAVMGHSLGGMIASMWGGKHPEAAGVINLDGHGNPRTDQYVGVKPLPSYWLHPHPAPAMTASIWAIPAGDMFIMFMAPPVGVAVDDIMATMLHGVP